MVDSMPLSQSHQTEVLLTPRLTHIHAHTQTNSTRTNFTKLFFKPLIKQTNQKILKTETSLAIQSYYIFYSSTISSQTFTLILFEFLNIIASLLEMSES